MIKLITFLMIAFISAITLSATQWKHQNLEINLDIKAILSEDEKKKKEAEAIKPFKGERYSFYKNLQDNNPDKNTSNYKVPKTSRYKLWCGSFRELHRAESNVKKIMPLTPAHYTVKGEWYVVMTDYLPNKRAAEALKRKIKKKLNIVSCALRREPRTN